MSKHQTIKTIRTEIDRINQEIDLRIIQGVSYRTLSMRHKFLMNQLVRLTPRRASFPRSFLGKSLSFMSAFMF